MREVLRALTQRVKSAVQVAQPPGLDVHDLVDRGQHALDELEYLLARSCDQVPIAAPVVVLDARWVPDRR